ncbi:MAG: NADH-quinone oxidoreductase subunit NuoB [Bacteriovoracaceae bacterium]|jgi:NADH-quinone oxidoreductase subunit B|nr:NADH-quinone oxidoreductase subunit NuoB [Bacteriovoracaceae bacterium]
MRNDFILDEYCLTTKASNFMEWVKRWAQSRSLWPILVGSGSSANEFYSLFGSRYDIERLGIDGIKYSPAQADLLVIAGPVTKKIFPILKNVYDQMTEPKWVIALGSEAIGGGLFQNHTLMDNWNEFIPVDVNIPGSPPSPESIIQGILFIRERIEKNAKPKSDIKEVRY